MKKPNAKIERGLLAICSEMTAIADDMRTYGGDDRKRADDITAALKFIDEAVTAYKARAASAPAAPDSWVLVPFEPTPEMLKASLIPPAEARRYYMRMLAAAIRNQP